MFPKNTDCRNRVITCSRCHQPGSLQDIADNTWILRDDGTFHCRTCQRLERPSRPVNQVSYDTNSHNDIWVLPPMHQRNQRAPHTSNACKFSFVDD